MYSPPPEFRPSELPDKTKEMPAGPRMPERRPDPIPAGKAVVLGDMQFVVAHQCWAKASALIAGGADQGVGSVCRSI